MSAVPDERRRRREERRRRRRTEALRAEQEELPPDRQREAGQRLRAREETLERAREQLRHVDPEEADLRDTLEGVELREEVFEREEDMTREELAELAGENLEYTDVDPAEDVIVEDDRLQVDPAVFDREAQHTRQALAEEAADELRYIDEIDPDEHIVREDDRFTLDPAVIEQEEQLAREALAAEAAAELEHIDTVDPREDVVVDEGEIRVADPVIEAEREFAEQVARETLAIEAAEELQYIDAVDPERDIVLDDEQLRIAEEILATERDLTREELAAEAAEELRHVDELDPDEDILVEDDEFQLHPDVIAFEQEAAEAEARADLAAEFEYVDIDPQDDIVLEDDRLQVRDPVLEEERARAEADLREELAAEAREELEYIDTIDPDEHIVRDDDHFTLDPDIIEQERELAEAEARQDLAGEFEYIDVDPAEDIILDDDELRVREDILEAEREAAEADIREDLATDAAAEFEHVDELDPWEDVVLVEEDDGEVFRVDPDIVETEQEAAIDEAAEEFIRDVTDDLEFWSPWAYEHGLGHIEELDPDEHVIIEEADDEFTLELDPAVLEREAELTRETFAEDVAAELEFVDVVDPDADIIEDDDTFRVADDVLEREERGIREELAAEAAADLEHFDELDPFDDIIQEDDAFRVDPDIIDAEREATIEAFVGAVDPELEHVDLDPDEHVVIADDELRLTDDVLEEQALAELGDPFEHADPADYLVETDEGFTLDPDVFATEALGEFEELESWDVEVVDDGLVDISDIGRRRAAAEELAAEMHVDVGWTDVRLDNGEATIRSLALEDMVEEEYPWAEEYEIDGDTAFALDEWGRTIGRVEAETVETLPDQVAVGIEPGDEHAVEYPDRLIREERDLRVEDGDFVFDVDPTVTFDPVEVPDADTGFDFAVEYPDRILREERDLGVDPVTGAFDIELPPAVREEAVIRREIADELDIEAWQVDVGREEVDVDIEYPDALFRETVGTELDTVEVFDVELADTAQLELAAREFDDEFAMDVTTDDFLMEHGAPRPTEDLQEELMAQQIARDIEGIDREDILGFEEHRPRQVGFDRPDPRFEPVFAPEAEAELIAREDPDVEAEDLFFDEEEEEWFIETEQERIFEEEGHVDRALDVLGGEVTVGAGFLGATTVPIPEDVHDFEDWIGPDRDVHFQRDTRPEQFLELTMERTLEDIDRAEAWGVAQEPASTAVDEFTRQAADWALTPIPAGQREAVRTAAAEFAPDIAREGVDELETAVAPEDIITEVDEAGFDRTADLLADVDAVDPTLEWVPGDEDTRMLDRFFVGAPAEAARWIEPSGVALLGIDVGRFGVEEWRAEREAQQEAIEAVLDPDEEVTARDIADLPGLASPMTPTRFERRQEQLDVAGAFTADAGEATAEAFMEDPARTAGRVTGAVGSFLIPMGGVRAARGRGRVEEPTAQVPDETFRATDLRDDLPTGLTPEAVEARAAELRGEGRPASPGTIETPRTPETVRDPDAPLLESIREAGGLEFFTRDLRQRFDPQRPADEVLAPRDPTLPERIGGFLETELEAVRGITGTDAPRVIGRDDPALPRATEFLEMEADLIGGAIPDVSRTPWGTRVGDVLESEMAIARTLQGRAGPTQPFAPGVDDILAAELGLVGRATPELPTVRTPDTGILSTEMDLWRSITDPDVSPTAPRLRDALETELDIAAGRTPDAPGLLGARAERLFETEADIARALRTRPEARDAPVRSRVEDFLEAEMDIAEGGIPDVPTPRDPTDGRLASLLETEADLFEAIRTAPEGPDAPMSARVDDFLQAEMAAADRLTPDVPTPRDPTGGRIRSFLETEADLVDSIRTGPDAPREAGVTDQLQRFLQAEAELIGRATPDVPPLRDPASGRIRGFLETEADLAHAIRSPEADVPGVREMLETELDFIGDMTGRPGRRTRDVDPDQVGSILEAELDLIGRATPDIGVGERIATSRVGDLLETEMGIGRALQQRRGLTVRDPTAPTFDDFVAGELDFISEFTGGPGAGARDPQPIRFDDVLEAELGAVSDVMGTPGPRAVDPEPLRFDDVLEAELDAVRRVTGERRPTEADPVTPGLGDLLEAEAEFIGRATPGVEDIRDMLRGFDRGQAHLIPRGRFDEPAVRPGREILEDSPRHRLSPEVTERARRQLEQHRGDWEGAFDPVGRPGRTREEIARADFEEPFWRRQPERRDPTDPMLAPEVGVGAFGAGMVASELFREDETTADLLGAEETFLDPTAGEETADLLGMDESIFEPGVGFDETGVLGIDEGAWDALDPAAAGRFDEDMDLDWRAVERTEREPVTRFDERMTPREREAARQDVGVTAVQEPRREVDPIAREFERAFEREAPRDPEHRRDRTRRRRRRRRRRRPRAPRTMWPEFDPDEDERDRERVEPEFDDAAFLTGIATPEEVMGDWEAEFGAGEPTEDLLDDRPDRGEADTAELLGVDNGGRGADWDTSVGDDLGFEETGDWGFEGGGADDAWYFEEFR